MIARDLGHFSLFHVLAVLGNVLAALGNEPEHLFGQDLAEFKANWVLAHLIGQDLAIFMANQVPGHRERGV